MATRPEDNLPSIPVLPVLRLFAGPVSGSLSPLAQHVVEKVPPELQGRYQKWKNELLSTEAGRKLWAEFNRPGFTLTICVAAEATSEDGGGKQEGRADGYQWDPSGRRLVAATITLGRDLGSGYPTSESYPVLGSLQQAGASGTLLAATKFAHELGHVKRTASLNPQEAAQYQERQALMETWKEHLDKAREQTRHEYQEKRKEASRGERKALDKQYAYDLQHLREAPEVRTLEARMGCDPYDWQREREHWAERATRDFLVDHYKNHLPGSVKDAIAQYNATYPGR